MELLDVVGKGTFATVYRALLRSLRGVTRTVAVKLFGAVSSDEVDHVMSLLARSARRLACINHPNVVRVYDCGVLRSRPFLVTELVDGGSLSLLPPDDVSIVDLHRHIGRFGIACAMPDGHLRIAPHWPNALDDADQIVISADSAASALITI